jgi:hypothetical protein
MSDNASKEKEKTIKLPKFDPNDYRAWAIQAKSALSYHKLFDIVSGKESNPQASMPKA